MRRIDKLIGFLAVLAFAACESTAPEHDGGQPEPPTPEGTPISLQSGLMPMASDGAKLLSGTDLQKCLKLKTGFDQDDPIGFFARMNKGEDIKNLQLTLKGKSFDSEVLADINAITQFFAYYPYKKDDGIYSEQGVSIYRNGEDGEVIDFLTTDYAGDGSSLAENNFFHTFAVVCIRCGDGFSHFDGEIYVQLQKMVKAVRINWDNWTGGVVDMVELVYDNDAISKERRRFKTTRFIATDGNTYWAAIIPCKPVHSYVPNEATVGGVTVESIVLSEERTETEIPVDNAQAFKATITENGNSQGETTGLRGGSIYHLELRKVGFEASVFPCKVEKWEEGESIQQTLENGIDDTGEFRDFVTECNRLFDTDRSYTTEEITNKLNSSDEIKRFGSDVGGTFTVFLKADIDFANTDFDNDEGMTPVISCLPIPIDGRGHTISNIRMNSGFCKSLRSTIKSLTFNNIRVVQPADSSDAVGMLADKMEDGGRIEDCHVINGWLEGNGNSNVGAAVGTMSAGTITGSSFAGIMIGETDTNPEYKGLVGVHIGGTIEDKNTNDMVKSTMQMGN